MIQKYKASDVSKLTYCGISLDVVECGCESGKRENSKTSKAVLIRNWVNSSSNGFRLVLLAILS